MLNAKDITILLTAGLIKKILQMSSQYFPPYVLSKSNNIKVVLDLSGYVKETDNDLVKKEEFSYFWGNNYFDSNDGTQNYLVFQVAKTYFKRVSSGDVPVISYDIWTSTGLSDKGFVTTKDIIFVKTNQVTRTFHVIFEKKTTLLFKPNLMLKPQDRL